VYTARLRPGCKQAGRQALPLRHWARLSRAPSSNSFSWRLAVAMGMQRSPGGQRDMIVSFPQRVIDEFTLLSINSAQTILRRCALHEKVINVAVAFRTTFPRV
jgi:hypothetical protein